MPKLPSGAGGKSSAAIELPAAVPLPASACAS
jgi:hypothetical protein